MSLQIVRKDITKDRADVFDARYMFFESDPLWIDGNHNEADMLRQSYERCLNLALENKYEAVALPLPAIDKQGFPKDISIRIAIDVFRKFLSENEIEIFLIISDGPKDILSDDIFGEVKSFVNSRYGALQYQSPFGQSIPRQQAYVNSVPASYSVASAPIGGAPVVPAEEKVTKAKKRLFGAKKKKQSETETEAVFCSPSPSVPLGEYVKNIEKQETSTFGEYLQQLINKKGMTNKEVYFESNLTKQYFSKLINDKVSNPAKEKLLCIAVALKLNIDETKDLLLHAGYALSPYSKIDLVFEYYIRIGKYDVYEISFALEELGIEGGLWPELAS